MKNRMDRIAQADPFRPAGRSDDPKFGLVNDHADKLKSAFGLYNSKRECKGFRILLDDDRVIDARTPLSELEAKEEGRGRTMDDFSTAVGLLLRWFIDAENLSLSRIGLRVLVATHKLRPELIGGMSFEEIAKQPGFGRSAAHKLSVEFERQFGVHGLHDRSPDARKKYARGYHQSQARQAKRGRTDGGFFR